MSFANVTAGTTAKPRTAALLPALGLFAATASASAGMPDAGSPRPRLLHRTPGTTEAAARQVLLPALRCYAFWNAGGNRLVREALSPACHDRNLSAGRPQGRDGPLIASRGCRQAVPDLKAIAEEVRVAGATVLGRLLLAGHFAKLGGQGQPAAFNATARFLHGDASTCLNA